jgi:predicted nicotinamide N-methyase
MENVGDGSLTYKRVFHGDCSDSQSFEVVVFDKPPQIFTYPSSIALSTFILANSRECIFGKRILELGAGNGLVSLVSAALGAQYVVATDRDDPMILNNLQEAVAENGASKVVSVLALDWDQKPEDFFLRLEKEPIPNGSLMFDTILGADIVYSGEKLINIFNILFELFCINRNAVFYMVYQERSSRRSIAPYLDQYSFKADIIPLETFVHPSHLDSGEITMESLVAYEENMTSSRVSCSKRSACEELKATTSSHHSQVHNMEDARARSVETFYSLALLKIYLPS